MRRTSMRAESGQATVELALGLPILALLLAGLVEVGMLVSDQARLWHAAREGARVAVVDQDEAEVRAAVERVGLKDVQIEIDPRAHFRRQGDPLELTLHYRPQARVPLFGPVVERKKLMASAVMRIEQP